MIGCYCYHDCEHNIKGIVRRLRKLARNSGHADISGLPVAEFLRHIWIHRSWVRPVLNGGVGDISSACELIGQSLAGTYPVFLKRK